MERIFAQLAQRLGVRREVRLIISSLPLGPANIGVDQPTVVVPDVLLKKHTSAELELVWARELIHIRRHDNVAGWLQLVAQVWWWFHPSIWWANREINRVRERCCDEAVLAKIFQPDRLKAVIRIPETHSWDVHLADIQVALFCGTGTGNYLVVIRRLF